MFGRAVGDPAKLPIMNPVPLVLDCPAQSHYAQQDFGAGTHRRDELVDMAKWLAVTLA